MLVHTAIESVLSLTGSWDLVPRVIIRVTILITTLSPI